MNKHIDGWEMKKLGDMGKFLRGKEIAKKDTTDKGIPCIRYGEIYTHHNYYIKDFYSYINQETAEKSTKIQKNDILFAGSGETIEDIGKSVAFLHDEEAYAGGDIVILRTKNVNSLYLAYALNNGRLAIERAKLGQGHSVVHIYPKELKSLTIQLPPAAEQDKITSILSTWDKAIELKEKLIEQKKEQKKGLMQKLLTGEVRLPGFEGEWNSVKIKEVCNVINGGTPSTKKKEYWNGNIPWCTPTDITSSGKYIQYTKQLITNKGLKNSSANLLPKNSILMCSRATIGPRSINKIAMATNQGFKSFVCIEDKLDYEFFYYLLFIYESRFKRLANGSTFLEVSKKDVEETKVFIPKDINEQKEIGSILCNADKEIELLNKQVNELKMQKKGLMQLLLTGKVRVKV